MCFKQNTYIFAVICTSHHHHPAVFPWSVSTNITPLLLRVMTHNEQNWTLIAVSGSPMSFMDTSLEIFLEIIFKRCALSLNLISHLPNSHAFFSIRVIQEVVVCTVWAKTFHDTDLPECKQIGYKPKTLRCTLIEDWFLDIQWLSASTTCHQFLPHELFSPFSAEVRDGLKSAF